jgi:hypothetical protein
MRRIALGEDEAEVATEQLGPQQRRLGCAVGRAVGRDAVGADAVDGVLAPQRRILQAGQPLISSPNTK